ncbi:MAG TPA: FAD-dependent monooxygenase, partial [Rhizobium sp.]
PLRWPSRRGLTLVGDVAHVMPPVGLGVNLAMLDAADLADTLISSADWVEAVSRFEVSMLDRAAPLAKEALIGFAEMFGSDAPRAMLEHMRTRRG